MPPEMADVVGEGAGGARADQSSGAHAGRCEDQSALDRHCLPRGRRDSACRPDGALSAFTRVFDALWRHPGTVASFEQESRISLTLNPR
jgi:hypothetical protein